MKKFLFIALLFPAISFCQNIDSLDAKNGYKNINFDMPADSVIRFTKAQKLFMNAKTEHYIVYILKKPYTQFGDFKCSNVLLSKYNKANKIGNVLLYLYDGDIYNYKKVLAFLTSLYGEPKMSDDNAEALWDGEKVRLSVKYSIYPENTSISISNKEVDQLIADDVANKFNETKKDF